MNVFISWSGERSKAVAEALREWLPKVLQSVEPWLSATDIEKGTKWNTEITGSLGKTDIGIVCLTPENLNAPWILFETGALSKSLEQAKVCTYLFDLAPTNVQWPLAMFQSTTAEREETKKLISTLNKALGDKALAESSLNETFELWWPKLDARLKAVPPTKMVKQPKRTEREILEEILELVRSQTRPLANLGLGYSKLEALNSLVGGYASAGLLAPNPKEPFARRLEQLKQRKREVPEPDEKAE